jgi:hypothetical protein
MPGSGARRHLVTGGVLVLYGPLWVAGRHTTPSNARFDVLLRATDPHWGTHDVEAVCDAAQGLELIERADSGEQPDPRARMPVRRERARGTTGQEGCEAWKAVA